MKTLLKKNALFVFALLLALGTMSFTLSEEDGWYYVNEDGESIDGPAPAPGQFDPCNTSYSSNLCKIQVSTPSAPTSVSSAYTNGEVIEDAFRTP
jgi:hypothetical protein